MQVNILEARNRLSELIKAARAGKEVVIANRGQPVARLIASDQGPVPAESRAGPGVEPPTIPGGLLAWLDGNPLPPHAQRSHDEIEAGIRAERDEWD